MDQEFKRDSAKMEQEERKLQWDIEKFYAEMENKERERLLKKEISQQQYDEKMQRIATDRQNRVDEMRMKIRTGGQGI
jgi:membrane protein involved in colicin uptake